MTDIVAAAFAAARYAGTLIRRTAEEIRFPPDEPHTDWQPKYGNDRDPTVHTWQPPYGETHVKYHIYRGGGGRNPIVWGANHHGTYQGMETVEPPNGNGDSYTLPLYSKSYEPDQLGRYKTPEKAKAAAEEHYRQNYSQPPRHDYDIDAIMGDEGNSPAPRQGLGDDEDYGHIFGIRRYAGNDDIHLAPEFHHDDWRPVHGDPDFADWRPYQGETHAHYRAYPVRQWAYQDRGDILGWKVSHDGTYQGMDRLEYGGNTMTFPSYTKDMDPDDLGWYDSLDEAKAGAEKHHAETYGQRPSPDYYDRHLKGDDLGDDYGNILGARRTAGMFDWKPEFYNGQYSWSSPTEIGHAVRVSDPHYAWGSSREIADRDENGNSDMGWSWEIHDLNRLSTQEPYRVRGRHSPVDRSSLNAELMGGKLYAPDHGTDPKVYSGDYLPTREHAERQLEKAYMELARNSGGQSRQRPDYDIDKIMGDPGNDPRQQRGLGDDEDYGNILGSRRRTAGVFDWKPSKRFHDSEATFAHLENGHQLGVFPSSPHNPEDGWDWYVWHGPKDDRGDRNVTGGGRGWDGDDRAYSTDHLPTKDHAQAAAEAAYSQLFPLGTSTGGHDSGVDYTQHMNPPDDLGEDYGNILGSRRYAAELSPPCPDCGQVAGFDTHPVSDRILVCRNCEYPMTDEGHDGLLDQTLSGHDRAVSSLPEVNHPSLGRHGHLDPADIYRLAGDGLSWEDTMAYIDQALAEGAVGDPTCQYPPDRPEPVGRLMTEYDPILAAIQATKYAEAIMRRTANEDAVPPWPQDMAHHLNEPTGYSAGYAAHFHPDFRDPTDDSYGRDYEDLENSYHAAGGTGPDFEEGVVDAANGISHKLDDPESYHGYRADQDAQIKRNRDSVNQQKQDEHNRLREKGKPTFRLDNEPEMPKGLGFGIDRGVTTWGPDYDNHPEGSWEGCPTCSDNGYGPNSVNYSDPDDNVDPFDPRIIGAGLHARIAANAEPVSEAVQQRIAAELSPPCPDCGQVAGFDEHMVSPRVKVCRNCEYPMTDIGHDGLLENILRGHDQSIGDLPETDHPNLGKHGGMSYEDTMKLIDDQLAAGEPEDKSDYSTDHSVGDYNHQELPPLEPWEQEIIDDWNQRHNPQPSTKG